MNGLVEGLVITRQLFGLFQAHFVLQALWQQALVGVVWEAGTDQCCGSLAGWEDSRRRKQRST